MTKTGQEQYGKKLAERSSAGRWATFPQTSSHLCQSISGTPLAPCSTKALQDLGNLNIQLGIRCGETDFFSATPLAPCSNNFLPPLYVGGWTLPGNAE